MPDDDLDPAEAVILERDAKKILMMHFKDGETIICNLSKCTVSKDDDGSLIRGLERSLKELGYSSKPIEKSQGGMD